MTITIVVEGFLAYAIAMSSRLAWLALGMSTVSAGAGLFWSATEAAQAEGQRVTWQQLVVAAVITVLSGLALGGTHYIRSRAAAERALTAERDRARAHEQQLAERAAADAAAREQAELAERLEQARHERELELERARSWARRDELAAQAEAERARAAAERLRVEGELQLERERAATERERAEAEHQRAQTERDRASAERLQAKREQLEDRRRAAAERAEAEAAAERAHRDRLRSDRAYRAEQWLLNRWSPAELAERAGISESRARDDIRQWRAALPVSDDERQTA